VGRRLNRREGGQKHRMGERRGKGKILRKKLRVVTEGTFKRATKKDERREEGSLPWTKN